MKGIRSLNFYDLEFNCNARTKIDRKCPYNGVCWKSIVVYKATCKATGKFYIGNTQQKLKARMTQHFNETKTTINKEELADSFARHFARQNEGETDKATVKQVQDRTLVEILWQGNPISACKTFGKLCCVLCMKERIEIYKAKKDQPTRLINSCNEIYGACRHRPVFHRYTNCNIEKSADEGLKSPKRVNSSVKNSNSPKRKRGRPRLAPICTVFCAECPEISPLASDGKVIDF